MKLNSKIIILMTSTCLSASIPTGIVLAPNSSILGPTGSIKARGSSYKMLLRAVIDYCFAVWDSYTQAGKQSIEALQIHPQNNIPQHLCNRNAGSTQMGANHSQKSQKPPHLIIQSIAIDTLSDAVTPFLSIAMPEPATKRTVCIYGSEPNTRSVHSSPGPYHYGIPSQPRQWSPKQPCRTDLRPCVDRHQPILTVLNTTVQAATNLHPGCILPSPTACVQMRLNTASFYGKIETFEDVYIHSPPCCDTTDDPCFPAINCRSTAT